MTNVEQWGIFELELPGPVDGNPFVDIDLSATFRFQNRSIQVSGFYDGTGIYRTRFMPDTPGIWHYQTQSNSESLAGRSGSFECLPANAGNHGPVRVHNTYHFAYADGSSYYQLGTTCYAWTWQGEALEQQTLETLQTSAFNKIRMCVFPKDYLWNKNEPEQYPFEGSVDAWDFSRFNPAYFQHLEKRIADLRALGIEADLILWHPYDRWGFSNMPAEVDERYLHYILARLAAYRNIWWSLANEYDIMKEKSTGDWDRFFRIILEHDPYQHLRSIHNWDGIGGLFYDHCKPWVTHASVQSSHFEKTRVWRDSYRKPIIFDECRYEGNVPNAWGNISAREMTHRFWLGTTNGAYVGHGETYLNNDEILWWSKGGKLIGGSPPRIAFLKKILADAPQGGLEPIDGMADYNYPCVGSNTIPYLLYMSIYQPAAIRLKLPKERSFAVDLLDTWEMTITNLAEDVGDIVTLELPSKPYMALRFREKEPA
ncbi:MAG: DUF5060 domain-containing protein [Chloroflexi bacterium AL-N5]|nr:DUF5060 domain-containing protein [Chloroflexi bacterium AL-N5]